MKLHHPLGVFGRAYLTALLASIAVSARTQSVIAQSTIANPPSGPWKKAEYKIAFTNTPPKIDGDLNDECWKTATHAVGFYRFQSTEPIHEQTEAWMCADKKNLYFAFHCQDSHPELIKTAETQREGDLSHDDTVMVAIDSQGTKRNISQFNVSARGTQQTQLEGGTADNRTWAGDWKAAAKRVPDGWTAEIAIPFSMLRYRKGAKSFGIVLVRTLGRETNAEIWPYIPPEGNNNPMPYVPDMTGIEPPAFAPHLVALPYVLGTAGTTSTLRGGIDLKYPVSTTLTGVGTLFPDFQTVEQAVTDLSFSYTEKFVPDRRPFFVEGSNLMQDSFLFYSQRIPFVDEGVKLVGKQDGTTISALATNTTQAGGQTAVMANVGHDLGQYSQVGGSVLSNDLGGQPSNQIARIFGSYGSAVGSRVNTLQGNLTESWLGGTPDRNGWLSFSSFAGHGKPGLFAYYTETGPNFVNQLGLVPETNLRGTGFSLMQYDNMDRGALETYQVSLNANTYRHQSGGFFHDDTGIQTSWMMRSGLAYELDYDASKYFPFEDNTLTTGFSWNQKSLLQRGGITLQTGHREDHPYQFLSLTQGIAVSKPLSLQLGFGYEQLDGSHNTQTVVTGTYRINGNETIGGRLVQQNGNVDVYLSYGRRVQHGTDMFVLLGDPNSPRTKHQVIVKLVWPF